MVLRAGFEPANLRVMSPAAWASGLLPQKRKRPADEGEPLEWVEKKEPSGLPETLI